MQTKNYLVAVRDRRYEYLARLLAKDGAEVRTWGDRPVFGIKNTPELSLLTQPVSLILPFNAGCDQQTEVVSELPEGSTVFGGKFCIFAERLAAEKNISCVNLLEDSIYNRMGALATAEGALAEAILHTPAVINGSQVLITGFGAVAKASARLFSAVGAKVSVAARKASARAEAEALGYTPLSLPITEAGLYSLIINTVPSPDVLSAEVISSLPGSPVILELASGKDNIDPDACAERGLVLLRLPSLPGRTAPESAARYIRDAIYRSRKAPQNT